MNFLPKTVFQNEQESRHLASEPHMRIQIMKISSTASQELFDRYHGELLIIIWSGDAVLKTKDGIQRMGIGDQCLLVDGEPFNLRPETEGKEIVAQMIWSPGMNPCEECWKSDGKFFQ